MDIRPRKPRVINLRKIKKQIIPVTSVKVESETKQGLMPEVKIAPQIISQEKCFECGSGNEDNLRCISCEAKHQEIVARLEARPKVKKEKVREKLYPFYSVKRGVEFTDWYSEGDLRLLGIPIPKE